MTIADNLMRVEESISGAAARAGRDPSDVTLVAVTKTVDAAAIEKAIDAGVANIGENYVQDSLAKYDVIGGRVRWHMIGHLQRNKVARAVHVFDLIQSVDNLALAREIAERSSSIGKSQDVLIEVNVSGEESKSGIAPEAALDLVGEVSSVHGVRVCGLMGIGPLTDDETAVRRSFVLLRELWGQLPEGNRLWLSMGMTSDFEVAIEEGSNMVRIGTAIFGPRAPRTP